MRHLSEQEAEALTALQRGIPITERPFAELGRICGLSEATLLNFVRRLQAEGSVRRFGAVFDARRLGYRSALCAMSVPQESLVAVVSKIITINGVTHAYERGWPVELARDLPGGPANRHWPNIWFTLATPTRVFQQVLEGMRTACQPYVIQELPALRRFKIDVVFDLRTRERDERVESRPPMDMEPVLELTLEQQALVKLCEGDIPIGESFFESLAVRAGISEQALLCQLSEWQAVGVIRRIGMLLRHREIGFKANGMCCWDLPQEAVLEAGRRLATFPEVTHCYERPWTEGFPFRLYAMIHTSTWLETQQLFERITRETELTDGQLMLSIKEFKKTSMQFF